MAKVLRKRFSQREQQVDECSTTSSSNIQHDEVPQNKKPQFDLVAEKRFPKKNKTSSTMTTHAGTDNCGMKTVMNLLGIDFEQTIEAKRRKIENFANDVIGKHKDQLAVLIREKSKTQIEPLDQLDHKTSEALAQWKEDIKTNKEQEAKTMKIFDEQIDFTQQVINQEKKRVSTLRKLQDTFAMALKDMESNLKKQTKVLNAELCANIKKVQKRIGEENAQQALV